MLLAPRSRPSWDTHDTRLIVAAVLGIALIIVLIATFKVHPFLALVAGLGADRLRRRCRRRRRDPELRDRRRRHACMEVGLLIALGAMLGKLLAESGGADQIVDTLVSRSGPRMVPWAMALVAVIVGLPMFFEIGLVLLLPVIVLVAKRTELPLMRVAIPALAGLSVLHGLIPPHPGPLIAIAALKAQLGITLALGLARRDPDRRRSADRCSRIVAARWVPVQAARVGRRRRHDAPSGPRRTR